MLAVAVRNDYGRDFSLRQLVWASGKCLTDVLDSGACFHVWSVQLATEGLFASPTCLG